MDNAAPGSFRNLSHSQTGLLAPARRSHRATMRLLAAFSPNAKLQISNLKSQIPHWDYPPPKGCQSQLESPFRFSSGKAKLFCSVCLPGGSLLMSEDDGQSNLACRIRPDRLRERVSRTG